MNKPKNPAAEPQINLMYAYAHILCGACQILDVVKGEWGDSWSEWDQSIRDGLSGIMAKLVEVCAAESNRRLP